MAIELIAAWATERVWKPRYLISRKACSKHSSATSAPALSKQIMEETGLSRATVTRHLAALREQGMVPAE